MSILDTIQVATPERAAPAITADFTGAKSNGTDTRASAQWTSRPADERYCTLAELSAAVSDRRHRSSDRVAPLRSFDAFMADGNMTLRDSNAPVDMVPTNYAFSQLCTAMGAPASYLRTLPGNLVADCLNHGFRNAADDVQVLQAGRDLRGITGPNYGRIWDAEVVEAIQRVTEAGNGRWEVPTAFRTADGAGAFGQQYDVIDPDKDQTTLYASDRDVFLFLVDQRNPITAGRLPDGSPDLYFRGFYAWNGECGGISNGVGTFLYRYVCCNRMIWGQRGFQKMRINHTKGAPGRFARDLVPALQAFIDGSATGIETGLMAARNARVARTEEQRHSFLEMYDFGPREQAAILDRIMAEEGHPAESVFDFVNGVTAHARSIANQDNRIAMERVGERMMNNVLAASA